MAVFRQGLVNDGALRALFRSPNVGEPARSAEGDLSLGGFVVGSMDSAAFVCARERLTSPSALRASSPTLGEENRIYATRTIARLTHGALRALFRSPNVGEPARSAEGDLSLSGFVVSSMDSAAFVCARERLTPPSALRASSPTLGEDNEGTRTRLTR